MSVQAATHRDGFLRQVISSVVPMVAMVTYQWASQSPVFFPKAGGASEDPVTLQGTPFQENSCLQSKMAA